LLEIYLFALQIVPASRASHYLGKTFITIYLPPSADMRRIHSLDRTLKDQFRVLKQNLANC
jgi:hypothetical protein